MFEILKFLTDCLIKVVPSIVREADVKNRTKLGCDLMLAYYALNRAILLGGDILDLLEACVARFDSSGENVLSEREVREGIGKLLHRQAESLEQISRFVRVYGRELQVVDGRSYRALLILLHAKFGAIKAVIRIMERGGIATNQAAVVERAAGKDESIDIPSLYGRDSSFQTVLDISGMLRQGTYILKEQPMNEFPEQLRNYVASGEGRKRLEDMAVVADSLRTSIVQEFSAAELVMHVRDTGF